MWIEIGGGVKETPISYVTPCTGVWIEIPTELVIVPPSTVTPCTGVWIEITPFVYDEQSAESLPARECGLK